MTSAYQTGIEGEAEAEAYLLDKGYQILDRRWKCPDGEIDLIALDGERIVFVEVKKRASQQAGVQVLEQLARAHNRHWNAAEQWIAANEDYQRRDMRFDVVLLIRNMPITHIENAFI